MNLEQFDLPEGICQLRGLRTRTNDIKLANLTEMDKPELIKKWLSTTTTIDQVDSVSTASTPSVLSSRSSLSKSSSKVQNIKLVPAGYKMPNSLANSQHVNANAKVSTKNSTIVDSTNQDSNTPSYKNVNTETQISEVHQPSITAHKENDNNEPQDDTKDETNSWDEVFKITNEEAEAAQYITQMKKTQIMKNACGVCNCKRCQASAKVGDEEKEEFIKLKKEMRDHKPSPLFAENERQIESVMTSASMRPGSLMDAKVAKILVHGITISRPQSEMSKSNLLPAIQDCLTKKGFKIMKPIQAYALQEIMRGNNVCMVNTSKTGKTVAYVSTLSSLLLEKDSHYSLPECSQGPKMIILANRAVIAEEIYQMFMAILDSSKVKNNIWAPLLPMTQKEINQRFTKKAPPTDVIITTPDTLILLLHNRIIDLKRLCHLVVENIDVILDKMHSKLELIFHAVDSMLKHRTCFYTVQLICTAQRWTRKIEQIVKNLDGFPLICIGNPMQAALYGRADLRLTYVDSKYKAKFVVDVLKAKFYNTYKTLIICKLNEIAELKSAFSASGIQFAVTSDDMEGQLVFDVQDSWKSTESGQHSVLICTDKVCRSYLEITNVHILIHYSLPPTWSMYSARFNTLIDSYNCPLTADFKKTKFYCNIITIVDERCMNNFPRLSKFFETNGIKIPDVLKNYCKEAYNEIEQDKVDRQVPLCKNVQFFGVCTAKHCHNRHILSADLDESKTEPLNGQITCRFITARQVNHYYVQILEYMDLNGKSHKLRDYGTEADEILKNQTGFDLASKIEVGKWYAYCDDKVVFRCVVDEIIEYSVIGSTATNDPSKVEIFGLDNAKRFITGVDKLYTLPYELFDIPQSAIKLIIANIIPPYNETAWTKRICGSVFQSIKQFDRAKITCVADIMLKLHNIIWADDLHFKTEYGPFSQNFSLSSHLKKRYIYETSTDLLDKLYALCKDANIDLPRFAKQEVQLLKTPKLVQSSPMWAYLDRDQLNKVIFSAATSANSVCVKLATFMKLLKQLEADIKKLLGEVHRKLNREEIMAGYYYALIDEVSGDYCRAMVTEIDNDIATCYYVDYGDIVSVPIDNLKFLHDHFITRLPFQAIECKLYGITETATAAILDKLYEFAFEADSDIFKILYAKVFSTEEVKYLNVKYTKYDIILSDFDKGVPNSFNEMLVEQNLAIRNNDNLTIEKTDILRLDAPDESDSKDEAARGNDIKAEISNNSGFINEDDFDVIISDEIIEKLKKTLVKPSTNKTSFVPMTAASTTSEKILPNVVWYQTDTQVFMELLFVENKDYSVQLIRNRLLIFKSNYASKSYEFNWNLYARVNSEFEHQSNTHCINVTLTKASELEWPRLVLSEERMPNIKYKIEKIKVEDAEEEEEGRLEVEKDIDLKYFSHIDVSPEGNVYEFYSDFDGSDSDYSDKDDLQ